MLLQASEKLEVPINRLAFFYLGFSVVGGYIRPETEIATVGEKLKLPYFKPKVFLMELTEEELNIKQNPESFIVIGLVTNFNEAVEYPSFNKVAFVTPTMTAFDLYLAIYKKMAHFNVNEYPDKMFSYDPISIDY